jgi:carboxypeptidase C (cathepsin A)
MVDAMGTGYSRLAKPDLAKKYYSMRGDIAAFGEFIHEYLAKNKRFSSPVFIAGESYGGIRTAGLSNYLLEHGIALNGAIIMSGVMNFGTLDSGRGNDIPYISFLPTMAATAWFHHKSTNKYPSVEAAVADATKFADGEYTDALMRGSSMSPDEIKGVAKKMAAITGLSESYILNSHLRVNDGEFFKELLRDEGKTTGRLDARFTGQDAREVGDGPEYDPAESAVTPVFGSMVNDYLGGAAVIPTRATTFDSASSRTHT